MTRANFKLPVVRVSELDNYTESFTFELPKGELTAKHIESYLKFLASNNMTEVLKTMITIYFAAISDDGFFMSAEEKIVVENTFKAITDHTDNKLFEFAI